MLKDDERKKIVDILNQRIGQSSCPICHKGHFSIVDGYSSNILANSYHEINLGGSVLPFVMLVCDNCGFISQHALGTLGLLVKQEESQDKKK